MKQAARSKNCEALVGLRKGLDSSLRASANGMKKPHRLGLLGPTRIIMNERTLRSIKVKKATAISTKIKPKKDTI